MIANIYGRHPSIETVAIGPCDISFGINCAPVDCDWLVFGDLALFFLLRDGVFTRRHRVGAIGPECLRTRDDRPEMGEYRSWKSLQRPFRIYQSGVISLLAAFRFGATEIHTYGMRREGDLHAGGRVERIKPLRWVRESAAHERMVAWLTPRGCQVIQH